MESVDRMNGMDEMGKSEHLVWVCESVTKLVSDGDANAFFFFF